MWWGREVQQGPEWRGSPCGAAGQREIHQHPPSDLCPHVWILTVSTFNILLLAMLKFSICSVSSVEPKCEILKLFVGSFCTAVDFLFIGSNDYLTWRQYNKENSSNLVHVFTRTCIKLTFPNNDYLHQNLSFQ